MKPSVTDTSCRPPFVNQSCCSLFAINQPHVTVSSASPRGFAIARDQCSLNSVLDSRLDECRSNYSVAIEVIATSSDSIAGVFEALSGGSKGHLVTTVIGRRVTNGTCDKAHMETEEITSA
ncbi:uncharacterized protein LOC120078055 isoform X2 [Benincasa hispida]|uniref:uncharacterized protein LOC120078055 isoform X2 n=1 Tax=Benincasa hispida TaxID=102211 RepID=UPI00190297E2|nr:uncharacterized protein LOC120078055 isoform X2 [Benincasa hispida]